MQIIREGEMWLAPQKVAAAFFGISIQAFQKWDYEPVRKEGRSKLYDVRAIQNDLDCRLADSEEELNLTQERARQAKETADEKAMANGVTRGELVETSVVWKVVGTSIQSAKTKLLAIPSQIARYLENQTSQNIESQLNDAIYESLAELAALTLGDVETAKKANGKSVGGPGKKTKRRSKRAAGQVAH